MLTLTTMSHEHNAPNLRLILCLTFFFPSKNLSLTFCLHPVCFVCHKSLIFFQFPLLGNETFPSNVCHTVKNLF